MWGRRKWTAPWIPFGNRMNPLAVVFLMISVVTVLH